ncbi:MAG: hypothetical protein IIA58_02135 [Candidatus Marinimicrobia bacterium]|nr:hypothetical protein [Candidatus Neomarinimicrobiota bacterium]
MKLRSWVIKVRGGSRIILKSQLEDGETDFLGSLKSSREYQRSPVESLPLKVNIEIPPRKMFAGTNANKNDVNYPESIGPGILTVNLTEPIDLWIDTYYEDEDSISKFKEQVTVPLLKAYSEIMESTQFTENEILKF